MGEASDALPVPTSTTFGAVGCPATQIWKSWSRRKTKHVSLQPFTVLHQSRCWSAGITCETTRIWCASRYIILCVCYLHSTYSSHSSLLCLASRGFRDPRPTPPKEPGAKARHNLKQSCTLNTNQPVRLIEMGSAVSQWRVGRSGLPLCEWSTASMTLCPTNGEVSASLRQLRQMKVAQAICWTNDNIVLVFICSRPSRASIIDTAKWALCINLRQ